VGSNQENSVTDLTDAERALLRRLREVGGLYTFRPDGESLMARRIFAEGMARVLLGLFGKGLVRVDPQATEVVDVPGAPPGQPGVITTITAELTETGREALR
jgi:hypothetical protein